MSEDETIVAEAGEVGTGLAVIGDVGTEVMEPEVIEAEVIDVEAVEVESKPEEPAEPKPPKPEPPRKTEEERRREELGWLLDKIVKANEWRRQAYREYEDAKSYAKEKKEIYEGALQALNKYNDALGDVDSRPLLLKCDLDHAEPQPEASEAEAATGEAEAATGEVAEPPGDWRTAPLYAMVDHDDDEDEIVDRICHAVIVATGRDPNEKGCPTADDLHHWMANGGRIVDLDLSDEDKVEFLDRLANWRSGYGWASDAEYPEAFPLAFVTNRHHELVKVRQRVKARQKKASKAAAS